MNRKLKGLGMDQELNAMCGPVLASNGYAEEFRSIQTTTQFKNHKDGSQLSCW